MSIKKNILNELIKSMKIIIFKLTVFQKIYLKNLDFNTISKYQFTK